jgi:RNA recognition motif-containing protein
MTWCRLYVTNLPSSKIQKEDLRTALYMLFSTHGPVLDVVALKTMKMRGQAHIVYRDIQTATQAMRSLDGFEIFGHKMVRQWYQVTVFRRSMLTGAENILRQVQVQRRRQTRRNLQTPHNRFRRTCRSDRPPTEHLQSASSGSSSPRDVCCPRHIEARECGSN